MKTIWTGNWLRERITVAILVALAALVPPNLASASGLSNPKGEVILTVEGTIGMRNDGEAARFDFDMLSALGTRKIVTSTIWTDGVIEFTGVPVVSVLAAVDAMGASVTASALNDYASTMPVGLLEDSGAILAFAMNGERMSRRGKGPLWLIFPYDEKPEYAQPQYKVHAVWQLNRLVIE